MKMRIWIVEATEPLPVIDQNFRELRCGVLARVMESRGHEVTWWTSTFDHMKKRHRYESEYSLKISPGICLELMPAPGYAKNISIQRVTHHRVLARYFSAAARNYQSAPDVIFTCWPIPELAEQAVRFGRSRGIPVIVDVRDLWPDIYLKALPGPLRYLGKIFLLAELRRTSRTLRWATGLTAVSKTYLDWALKYARRSIQEEDGVFPLGYSVKYRGKAEVGAQVLRIKDQYGLTADLPTFFFVGMLGHSYDLETLIRAARRLCVERSGQVRIIIAGDGDKAHELKQMAAGLNNVIFTGWISEEEIWAFMQLADVGLAAYTQDALQSLPNKPFEYWAAGLPVLSSLPGELERLLEEEEVGCQYQAGKVDSLVRGMEWFLEHPQERKQMGDNARKLLEGQFDAQTISQKLVEYLEKIGR
jgi:glycosyltransferase involved in cell wall biosynthesis